MVKRGPAGFLRDIGKNPFSYLLVLPAALYTLVFGYFTLPYLVMAFQKFSYDSSLFANHDFIGFKNFAFFFKSNNVWTVTWNTLRLNFLYIVLGHGIAIAFAVMMNEVKSKWFMKTTQSTFLFPHFLSWVVVSYIVYNVFSTQYGVLNQLLQSLGLERQNWYAKPEVWTEILVGMNIWKETGIATVIYLAAIVGIDSELYEAARIDGASRWQMARRITVPLLMPTAIILVLLAVGKIFYGNFAMLYSIIRDNGLLLPTTDVIDTYVFRALRTSGDPAQAMAVGLYQAFMGFIIVFGINRLIRKYFPEGALF
ncbi:ABC transporter permease [Paenibacillus cymbidii]|uniref:ABC transporter permease n=1 Tax=Paenibacillus cymbidii TaxID=1639034 RepID=UPI00108228DF|nr:ABC transporter permease subunit [Paenibacillus cymbidii]